MVSHLIICNSREVSGGPGLRTLSSHFPGLGFKYLIQDLISHKPHGLARKVFCNSIKTLLPLGPEGQREEGGNLPRAWDREHTTEAGVVANLPEESQAVG